MLALLHDHMGRRTVENPDLAHRAARHGLTGKVREMEEHGYTVIENAISRRVRRRSARGDIACAATAPDRSR